MANDYDRKLYQIANLYFDRGLSKADISKVINQSPTHVARLLDEARARGIVSIKYSLRHCELEDEIRRDYQLRDVIVVDRCGDETSGLGAAAAKYFEARLLQAPPSSDGPLFAIGGGGCLLEMVEALPERKRNLRVVPSSIIGRGPHIQHIDPYVLTTLLWDKCGRQNVAYGATIPRYAPGEDILTQKQRFMELPDVQIVVAQARAAHVVFAGVGAVGPEGNSTTMTLLKEYGVSPESLAAQGIIGEMANCFYDANGDSRPEWEYFVGLSTGDFRSVAAKPGCDVVLVGGGEKARAIQAALRGKLASVLITESKTAEELVEFERRGGNASVITRAQAHASGY